MAVSRFASLGPGGNVRYSGALRPAYLHLRVKDHSASPVLPLLVERCRERVELRIYLEGCDDLNTQVGWRSYTALLSALTSSTVFVFIKDEAGACAVNGRVHPHKMARPDDGDKTNHPAGAPHAAPLHRLPLSLPTGAFAKQELGSAVTSFDPSPRGGGKTWRGRLR
ncbi:hypothetical protein FB451DRAFT_1560917 [Mycena latifolia]|nr:hypothetical protein FB451DRAFT_1560917 [Mycena latifolia]